MLQIIFTACSVLHGAQCNIKTLVVVEEEGGVLPYGCMKLAVVELIKWQEMNPNWHIESWRCGTPKKIVGL